MVAAMFASGVATFALLHDAQAILPLLSAAFRVSPASASLAVSVATGSLALGVIPVSVLSERYGRARVMTCATLAAVVLGLLVPLCRTFPLLLAARGMQGLALAGLPAVAVAYLAEEIHPAALPGAVGTLISGNSLGGLAGRLLAGAVADLAGWRVGVAAVGLLAMGCGVAFVLLLPAQQHFTSHRLDPAGVLRGLRGHLGNPALLAPFGIGALVMAAFATLYNYAGYRLLLPPFSLTPALVGLVFLAYLAGTASSTVASGLVGRRATTARAHASALYTLAYYTGASLGGWTGGLWYERGGWPAVVVFTVGLLVGAGVLAAAVGGRQSTS